MIATAYIKDCIINPDKTRLIHDAIAAGTSQYGMQTFDQSLFDLYSKELITLDEALMRASNPDEFKLRIQGIRSAADAAREEMASQMADFERFARFALSDFLAVHGQACRGPAVDRNEDVTFADACALGLRSDKL